MPARIHRRPSRAPSRTLAQRHAQRRALLLEPLEARQMLALIAVFDNPTFVDTDGGPNDESDTIQASLTSLGHTVTTFTATTAAGIAAALAGKDAVVFPEFENGDPLPAFDAAARAQVASFVSGGGGLITAYSNSTTADFLNGVFGFNLLSGGYAATYGLSPSASGTAFGGGIDTLSYFSDTISLVTASLPPGSRAIYTSGGYSAVSWMPYGQGAIVNLGWDWFYAAPLGSLDGGWIDVLSRSVLELTEGDSGDAPASFGSARHEATGPQLGGSRDLEAGYFPSAQADRDDIASLYDEDGLRSVITTQLGGPGAVVVNVQGVGAQLDAWIDFNANGTFDDPAEKITQAGGAPVVAGANRIDFTLPASIAVGDHFLRLRLSSVGGLGPTGFAADGEVEDYRIGLPLAAANHEVVSLVHGGAFQNRHLSGLTTDPVTGDLYVVSDPAVISPPPNTSNGYSSSFTLHRVTPSGVVTPIGGVFSAAGADLQEIERGPDGGLYYALYERVRRIDPVTGAVTVFNSHLGFSVNRYGLEFDSAGDLILYAESGSNEIYRVRPGSGVTLIGSASTANGDHGDDFGIQPDGDYVVYPDNRGQPPVFVGNPNYVFELDATGHVDGTAFPLNYLSGTNINTLGNGYVYSTGTIDPVTGDVYTNGGNNGGGSTTIVLTPGNGTFASTSSTFVTNIGNGILGGVYWPNSSSRGATRLDFGKRTDGNAGNSLFFLDDYTDTIYEVRSRNAAPVFTSSAEFSVPENSTAVGTVAATDSDLPAQTVSYSITGGADAGKFDITTGGVLTFNSAPNFESPTDAAPTDNVYQLEVTASDGAGGTAVQLIAVTVTNVTHEVAITRVRNAAEGDVAGQFRVSIPIASASDLVVSYSVGGSATSGADYTPLSGTVTIGAGQLSATIDVGAGADDLVEATENVTVTLTSTDNQDYAANLQDSLDILGGDAATFTIEDVSVNEAAGTLTFTITSSKKIDIPVSVLVTYGAVGASAATGGGVDYDSATDTATFPAETLTQAVTVAVNNDLLSEGAETFLATLALDGTYYGDRSLTADDTAEGEIVDNDVDLRVTGSGSPNPMVLAGSGPGNLSYELTVTNAGLTTATNVQLSAALTLPAGVTIDSITPEAGSFTPSSPTTGTWTVASLAPSTSLKLTVVLTVGPTAADGASIGGSAQVVSANEVLVATEDDSASLATTVQALDFGDAPANYGTLLAAGGPRHRLGLGPKLGAAADPEADGQPSATASGDDAASDDEDGVLLPGGLVPGLAAQVQVTASGAAKLDAWVDFNRNSAFEPGEQVFASQTVAAGANLLSFAVPSTASSGATYARFRLSTAGGLGPTGLAADGEVEDYAIAIGSCTPGSAVLVSDPLELGGVALLVCGTVSSDAISVKPSATPGASTIAIAPFPTPSITMVGAYTRIIVQARGGNDSIAIDSRLTVPTLLYGDAGNDTISGGSGPDVIYGGEGTDSLAGNAGDDQLFGEAGADRLYGGAGNDAFTESGAGAFVLSASQLTIAGASHTLSGLERAVLQGGAGTDSFNVGAWPGTGAVDGGGGTDKLLAAGNVNFTLTNSSLARSVGGSFTLASIEEAELTGGTGNNTLDASSFGGRLKLDGGSGNDLLKSGAGPALLLGGAGNDQLQGGGGRTVQIGGAGVDTLLGGGGDDLLISGTTSYDTNAAALAAILNEWASAADYATRVAHLKGTLAGGLNGTFKLTATTAPSDTSSDTLTGGGGLDWFFAKLANPYADVLSDLAGGETVN